MSEQEIKEFVAVLLSSGHEMGFIESDWCFVAVHNPENKKTPWNLWKCYLPSGGSEVHWFPKIKYMLEHVTEIQPLENWFLDY